MDSQFSTISVPNYRKSRRYNFEDIKTSYSSNTNDDLYNLSSQKQRERISTYDKIIHELSKDERKSFGTPLLSIIGRGDTNIISPNTRTGNNHNVGGTLTLYPSGGILFKNINTSLNQDFPDVSSQLPSETNDTSTRGSSSIAKSPRQLLDFVEKFNMEEDESLSPHAFLEYRDSQSDDLTTESSGTVLYGNNQVYSDTIHEAEKIINDLSYNNFLEKHNDDTAHIQTVEHNEKMFPKTHRPLDPLPIISFPLEASSLKKKVSNPSVYNTFEIPELLSKENIPNITIYSAADSLQSTNLIPRVRSISISSMNSDDESLNLQDKENTSVSPMSSTSKTLSLKASDAVTSTSTNSSSSSCPIPPSRDRKLSESLSGFFTGFFGSSPTQTLSERTENIKEVAEMSMIFRY